MSVLMGEKLEHLMNQRASIHTVAIVIPVFMGEFTLETVVGELQRFQQVTVTPGGVSFVVEEIVLVHDCGPDKSDDVIRMLSRQSSSITPVWLSRNFGQHAATLAGMAATKSDWVVTLDEDGQHDPSDIAAMLDEAVSKKIPLIYATPKNRPQHSVWRNLTSKSAKLVASKLAGTNGPRIYSSFRLVAGEVARSLAAFAGPSLYLDVALAWICRQPGSVSVVYREERRLASGYSARSLMSHFWKLAVTTGTRPLRVVSLFGALVGILGISLSAKIIFDRLVYGIAAAGWASVLVSILVLGGSILFSIGVIAEYIGLVAKNSSGQPTYLTIRDPIQSPVHGFGTRSESE
jgi:glycosyltransferase involved in cell wall biosynthesis